MKVKCIKDIIDEGCDKIELRWVDADELLDFLEEEIINADDEITVVALKKVLKGIYECYKDQETTPKV